MNISRLLITIAFACSAPAVVADVDVLGLFKGAALLEVDGEQKLVKAGQQWKGVRIIEADSRRALAEINGGRVTLTVSTHISSSYTVPETRRVTIKRNSLRQYLTTAEINGRRLSALVDTGANIVAISSVAARALGLDYERGVPGQIVTASGVVEAWSVFVSVDVGGIKIDNVQASVLEGEFPETILLGMSFLQHVELREANGVLSLTARF